MLFWRSTFNEQQAIWQVSQSRVAWAAYRRPV
jgi:hypothetical protein